MYPSPKPDQKLALFASITAIFLLGRPFAPRLSGYDGPFEPLPARGSAAARAFTRCSIIFCGAFVHPKLAWIEVFQSCHASLQAFPRARSRLLFLLIAPSNAPPPSQVSHVRWGGPANQQALHAAHVCVRVEVRLKS